MEWINAPELTVAENQKQQVNDSKYVEEMSKKEINKSINAI